MKPKEYIPGGEYVFIADLESFPVTYSPLQEEALQSHNHDTTYPAKYCNSVVYGGYEMEIDSVIHLQGGLVSTKKYEASALNLSKPIAGAFNQASALFNNMIFGQEAGETEPAKLEISYPISGGTVFTWYKNGAAVTTDTLTNACSSVVIAVQYSGTTILNYAYVYRFNDAFWTSGVQSDSQVLAILNTGGDQGSDETKHGWEDAELGDFVLSLIFSNLGNDAQTGNASDTVSGSGRPGKALTNLEGKCEQYGGYLGTDLIEYMSEGQGWNYLKTQADNNTPISVQIPTAVENKYVTISCKNRNGVGPYFYMIDPDGNEYYVGTGVYERGVGKVYLTWYPQSAGFNSSSQIIMCLYRDNGSQGWYAFTGFDLQGEGAVFEDFEPEEDSLKYIAGYDPESGQEDDPQEDPADIDDPENDPLASGFLYAFMVGASDMANLADCLVPETLAQKIRGDFGNNLYEFIVSYHMVPCLTNADSLNKVNILYRGQPFVYGENDTQLALAPISKTWYDVSCGTRMCIPKNTRFNGFENWSQAQIQLYLPFIGYVHLNTADVWNKPITIGYKIDILQGTCTANVGVGTNGTIYSFEGSCKYSIPFTSTIDKSNQELLSGIFSSMGAAVSLGGTVASGSPAGVIGAVSGGGDAVGHFLSAFEHKSTINRSGSLSGSPGWLMPRKPALLITIPDIVDQTSTFYNNLNGYPCCVSDYLSNYMNYYVEVGQIDLHATPNGNGSVPNDTELDMIKSQLKEGVYV